MIPQTVKEHLDRFHPRHEHHRHRAAMTAQDLAHAEHVTGYRVAKSVIVRVGGEIAIAVIAATDRVNLSVLEEATASAAELVPEAEFTERFAPCEAGAEPPLAIFGAQIFADEMLLQEDRILMPAGTHEDSVVLDTHGWIACERVQAVANLAHRSAVRVHWEGAAPTTMREPPPPHHHGRRPL